MSSESKCPFSNAPSSMNRRFFHNELIDIDLSDPDFHSSDARHEYFQFLRENNPVCWCPETYGSGFWSVTRYEDVITVLKDPSTFSSDSRNGGNRIFNVQDVTPDPRPHLLTMDPPQHTHLRRALNPIFTAAKTRELEKGIRRRVSQAVSSISSIGHADFVKSVAIPVTVGLLSDILEVPESDSDKLLALSLVMVGDDDPEYQLSAEERRSVMREFDQYVMALCEDVNNKSSDSLLPCLMNATIDGRKMDFETLTVNVAAFLIAGNETTRHAISRSLQALTEYPEERQKLIEEPDLIPIASKELLRWATPLIYIRKTAMKDTELGGQAIKKGDKVVIWYSSANRDEDVWPDAGKLKLDRYLDNTAAPHLAFGFGSHFCLGWRLAEIQLSAVLAEVLSRIPDIHVVNEPEVLRSNFIYGIKRLNVSFTPEKI